MTKIKDNLVPLSLMLTIPVLSINYRLLNTSGKGVHSLTTDLDRFIPFVKIFIIPYVSWYLFIFIALLYLFFNDRSTYYKTIAAIDIGLVICYAVYYFYQTTVPRPVVLGNDIFSSMIAVLYSFDRPYNCFPSIHVLMSFLIIKAISSSQINNWFANSIIYSTAALIIASTLFIKQHVFVDVIAALFLGDVIFKLVCNYNGERVLLWKMKNKLNY